MSYTIDEMIAKYVEFRNYRDTLKHKHAEELKPVLEAMDTLESIFLDNLSKNGIDSVSSKSGTIFKSKIMAVKIENKQEFTAYAFGVDMGLLDIRASKTGIKEHMEVNPSLVIPGIKIDHLYNINIRRK
jgi:hypothetical protein